MPVPLQNYYVESSRRVGAWVRHMRSIRGMSRFKLLVAIDEYLIREYIKSSDSLKMVKFHPEMSDKTIMMLELGKMPRIPLWILEALTEAFNCTIDERMRLADCITPDVSSILQVNTDSVSMSYANVLSDRERSVIRLGARGLKSREIGKELVITKGCVDTHWHNIRRKLGVNSREQAINLAVQQGLV